MKSNIKILGSPCCTKGIDLFKQNLTEATSQLGIDAEIEPITDIVELSRYGISSFPTLIVDNKAVIVGRVAQVDELKEVLLDNIKTA